MIIKHLRSGVLGVNSYLIINEESNKAFIIDPGEKIDKVWDFVKENGVELKYVLLTHAHFDHSGVAKKMQDSGVKIYIGKYDADKLSNDGNMAFTFNRKFENLVPDVKLEDNAEIELCGIKVKVLLTPGHTDGSLCYIIDNNIFTGDTLFCGSFGRTDFISGNFNDIKTSINRLFNLKGNYNVYPGHEDFTTLDNERKYNEINNYD